MIIETFMERVWPQSTNTDPATFKLTLTAKGGQKELEVLRRHIFSLGLRPENDKKPATCGHEDRSWFINGKPCPKCGADK